jgi:hypothetical protein
MFHVKHFNLKECKSKIDTIKNQIQSQREKWKTILQSGLFLV